MAKLPPLVSDPSVIRDIVLSTFKSGMYNIGVPNFNVSEGSDPWVLGEVLASQYGVLTNYLLIAADILMPDTATDVDLDRWLGILGLQRKPAGGSTGSIALVADFEVFIPLSSELTSSTGVRYNVIQGGTYDNGDIIPIASVDVGSQTNLIAGTVLTWSNPPFGVQTTVPVHDELIGGIDVENDDVARERLMNRFAHAPASANWQWICDLSERISTAVQKGFVYPAANGPSTVHVALAGTPAIGTKSRQIDSLVMNQTITPTILGNMPEYVETVVTTVTDLPVDISISLTIPLAKSAASSISGPGSGNGWKDASPFPRVNLTTHFFVPVTAFTSASQFTIDSPAGFDPVPNITRIHWIDRNSDPAKWTIKEATITGFSGTGPYVVTINNPFVGLAVGDWIFPASLNAQNYIDKFCLGTSLMGPGEKVDIGVFGIASRKPRQSDSFPSALDTNLLRYVIDAGEEVQTASYYYRSTQTPAVVDDATANVVVIPPAPAVITDAPNILIPRQVGFYPPFPLV